MKKLKSLAINLAMMLTTVIIVILATEIGLRIAGIEGLRKVEEGGLSTPSNFHIADRDRGWALRPGARGWWRSEGEAFIEINSQGLRDREHEKVKPENTFRIAILGDSFAEAFQVPMEETFWAVIPDKLKQCIAVGNRKIETINFGVHGYGTAQQLITLRQQVWDYNPDLIILAFFLGNDIINNSRKLEYGQNRPFLNYENGELIPDMSFRELTVINTNRYSVSFVDRLPAWLVNNSRILQLAKKVEIERKRRQLSKDFNLLIANNFKQPPDEVWQQAWQVTEAAIAQMAKEVKTNETDFFLVIIPDAKQVHYDPLDRKRYMKENNIEDFLYPNKRIEGWGDRHNFPVLDLAKPFQTYAESNQVCLHGFENAVLCNGHWNPEGHQLAGEKIAERLCKDF